MSSELGLEPIDPVSVVLPSSAAKEGKNFYRNDVLDAVTERFPRAFHTKLGRGSRAGDAFCSAHAPFNLVAPLRSRRAVACAAPALSAMLGVAVHEVQSVNFEQPGSRDQNPLGDNTAYDSCISAIGSGSAIKVGIEVKFSEGPYGWGESEKRRMFDPESQYCSATTSGGFFQPKAADGLRNCHLKQLWRNMLLAQTLGASLLVQFYYVHLYPEGNDYQAAAVAKFASALTDRGRARFRSITYEKYFHILGDAGCDADWVSYLRRRYLVATA